MEANCPVVPGAPGGVLSSKASFHSPVRRRGVRFAVVVGTVAVAEEAVTEDSDVLPGTVAEDTVFGEAVSEIDPAGTGLSPCVGPTPRYASAYTSYPQIVCGDPQ